MLINPNDNIVARQPKIRRFLSQYICFACFKGAFITSASFYVAYSEFVIIYLSTICKS
jgi:hypothetical protein